MKITWGSGINRADAHARFIVYLVTGPAGKVYVGKTEMELQERWACHVKMALYKNSQTYLHRAIRKHGPQSFVVTIIGSSYQSRGELDNAERLFVLALRSADQKVGYNQTEGGTGGRQSEEVRTRMSVAASARPRRPMSEETKRKISERHKGKKHSTEWIAKMAATKTGRPWTQKQREARERARAARRVL